MSLLATPPRSGRGDSIRAQSLTDTVALRLSNGETLTLELTDDIVAQLKAAIRAWGRSTCVARDLANEIHAFLADHPASSAIEIARELHIRDRDVRRVLDADPRFIRVSPPPGRSTKLRAWAAAQEEKRPVPAARTRTSAARSDHR